MRISNAKEDQNSIKPIEAKGSAAKSKDKKSSKQRGKSKEDYTREKNAIQKGLGISAKSTASMGKFDKKLQGKKAKHDQVDDSHKYLKRIENKKVISSLQVDTKGEKNRNLKILQMMERSKKN